MEETDDNNKREARSRKSTTFYQAAVVPAPKKVVATADGKGIKLSENPHFCKELEKYKSDNEVCKALHSLMYNVPGKKTEIKKNLRAFSGFSADTSVETVKTKVGDKKKLWTVSLLKTSLGLFGLERGGDRDTLVERLVDYIAEPAFTKTARAPKRKGGSDGKSRKNGKKAKIAKKSGPKKAPTAYILFSVNARQEAKEANPDASFVDLTRILGQQWNALSAEEKEVWAEKARAHAAALQQAAEGSATVEDIDFGDESDNGDAEEEEDEDEAEDGDDGVEDDDFKDLDGEAEEEEEEEEEEEDEGQD